jgi:hypothetical protein
LFPKCSKTDLRASANPNFFQGLYPGPLVKGGGEEVWEERSERDSEEGIEMREGRERKRRSERRGTGVWEGSREEPSALSEQNSRVRA